MRGEYPTIKPTIILLLELPPRARRIRQPIVGLLRHLGTTSACAENTAPHTVTHITQRNYLRVRGEYQLGYLVAAHVWELPPRARRIQDGTDLAPVIPGTTSACAENTLSLWRYSKSYRNYHRVRGEYLEGKTITER